MERMDSYNHQSYGQCDVDAPSFRTVAQVGTKAPGTYTDVTFLHKVLQELGKTKKVE